MVIAVKLDDIDLIACHSAVQRHQALSADTFLVLAPHFQYEPCGPVDHNEFLAINGQNPLRDIAEYCCLDTYAMVKVLGKLYMSCGLPKSQSSSCK
jgi:hypothetical protein